MKLQEFKVWMDGFMDAIGDGPMTDKHKEKIREMLGKVVMEEDWDAPIHPIQPAPYIPPYEPWPNTPYIPAPYTPPYTPYIGDPIPPIAPWWGDRGTGNPPDLCPSTVTCSTNVIPAEEGVLYTANNNSIH